MFKKECYERQALVAVCGVSCVNKQKPYVWLGLRLMDLLNLLQITSLVKERSETRKRMLAACSLLNNVFVEELIIIQHKVIQVD